MFLLSRDAGFSPFHQGSQGNLCLAGSIGRFPVATTGALGRMELEVDPASLPTAPPVSIQPGETWHFQAWFRDGRTSNFTDGVAVAFD